MANEHQIRSLLREVAEKLTMRKLTDAEASRLYDLYQKEYGTPYSKAASALGKFSGLSERQIIEKRSASDDLDRVMQDLRRQSEEK